MAHTNAYSDSRKLNSLQALRAIAAMLVVVYHAQSYADIYVARYGIESAFLNSTPEIARLGSCGVDIFFILSGFIIAYTTKGKRGGLSGACSFFMKRCLRIFPTYWFYTSALVVLQFVFPHLFHTAKLYFSEVVLSYLLIPYVPYGSNTSPVLQVGWTLTYEMYFYSLFTVLLYISSRFSIFWLGCFVFACVSIGYVVDEKSPILNVITSPLIIEFYMGALFAFFYRENHRNTYVSMVLILLAMVWFFAWSVGDIRFGRILEWGMPAFLMVVGFAMIEQRHCLIIPRCVVLAGDASYTVYLSNALLVPAFGKISARLGVWEHVSPDMWIIAVSVLCGAVGVVLYRAIEVPVSRFTRMRPA